MNLEKNNIMGELKFMNFSNIYPEITRRLVEIQEIDSESHEFVPIFKGIHFFFLKRSFHFPSQL